MTLVKTDLLALMEILENLVLLDFLVYLVLMA